MPTRKQREVKIETNSAALIDYGSKIKIIAANQWDGGNLQWFCKTDKSLKTKKSVVTVENTKIVWKKRIIPHQEESIVLEKSRIRRERAIYDEKIDEGLHRDIGVKDKSGLTD